MPGSVFRYFSYSLSSMLIDLSMPLEIFQKFFEWMHVVESLGLFLFLACFYYFIVKNSLENLYYFFCMYIL